MSRHLISLGVHLVWATKQRTQWLGAQIRPELFAYMAGTVAKKRCRAIVIGGWEDHVHLYVHLCTSISVAHLVTTIKTSSARWLKEREPALRGFRWQRGFAAFGVDPRRDSGLREYIESQDVIHLEQDHVRELDRLASAFALDRSDFAWD
jgi:REP element-mobilizing transposase RayT